MAIKNKITVLFEHANQDYVSVQIKTLEKYGWQVHPENLSDVSMVLRGWLKASDMFWFELVSSPFVSSLSESIFNWARKQFVRLRAKQALSNLRKFQPPIILATSYTSALTATYFKSKKLYRGKVVLFLPGFDLDPLWVLKEIDLYICSSERQAETLRQRQVDSSKIVMCKPDIKDAFFVETPKDEALARLGLMTTMPVVLMFSEVIGADVLKESFLKIIRLAQSCQVAIFSNSNSDFRSRVEKITAPVRHPVKVFSRLTDLPDLLSSAAVVIGPLMPNRLSEAAAKRVPIIITDPELSIPNSAMKFLVEQNAVAFGRIPAETVFLTETILDGRKATSLQAASDILVEPKNSMLFSDALATINPSNHQPKI